MSIVTIRIDSRGVTATPDPVKLPYNRPNHRIKWRIATPGWSFTRDGIVIQRNDNQFVAREIGKRVFAWHSKNSNHKKYEYTINVMRGATRASCDPGIQNGGRH